MSIRWPHGRASHVLEGSALVRPITEHFWTLLGPRFKAELAKVRARGVDQAEYYLDGIVTMIGEGGHQFGPMQTQMIALARRVLRDRRITPGRRLVL